MIDSLLPDIDLGSFVVPALVVGGLAVFGYVFVAGALRSFLSGNGHFGIIEAYTGFVRHGKTMLAVQDCIRLAVARNAVLASNIGIVPPGAPLRRGEYGPPKPLIETVLLRLTDDGLDLEQVRDLALRLREEGRGLVLLIDEAGIVMPARQWATFPVGLMWLLQQSGKLMVEIRYTTQHPAFVDTQLRSLTAVVHRVRATPPPSIERRVKGRRPWFMTIETMVPGDYEKVSPDRIMWRRRVRYRREWETAYDTDAAVLPAGRLKGAAELHSAIASSGVVRGLDPRLRAQLDGLPRKQREAIVAAIEAA